MTFENYKNIVIKIGSSLLADDQFDLRKAWLQSLADDIADMKRKGKNVVIVSSGAVAIGRKNIVNSPRKLNIEEKQAAAAIGQPRLIAEYQKCFNEYNLTTAQVLLTISDIEDRRRYLNAKNTFETLLQAGVIPVVNENDTVATYELRVGDNDRLSAQVAQMIGADLLIILSDINGLYTDDPNKNPEAKHIPIVSDINDSVYSSAKGATSATGSGGMSTKIMAAKTAADSGCSTIITLGKFHNPLSELFSGGLHTLFTSKENPIAARKAWILNRLLNSGSVIIDDGAVTAVKSNKSLLAVGIKEISGNFTRGDKISIHDSNNNLLAYGISAFGNDELKLIIGKKSADIEAILGYSGRDSVVHKDNLVLL